MRLNKTEWAALNTAVAVAENEVKDYSTPEGIALRARVIAARALLDNSIPEDAQPKKSYLPSRHPMRNN